MYYTYINYINYIILYVYVTLYFILITYYVPELFFLVLLQTNKCYYKRNKFVKTYHLAHMFHTLSILVQQIIYKIFYIARFETLSFCESVHSSNNHLDSVL